MTVSLYNGLLGYMVDKKDSEKKYWEGSLVFTPNSGLSSEERGSIAKLIYRSFQEFYDLLPCPHHELIKKLIEQMNMPNNEISAAIGASLTRHIVGGYAALPASSLSRAQMMSAMRLIKGLSADKQDAFLRELPRILGTLPGPAVESFYLSRIAVVPAFQGHGVAGHLIEHFITSAKLQKYPSVSLHVHKENNRAINFYKKCGFKSYDDEGKKYRCLWKSLE